MDKSGILDANQTDSMLCCQPNHPIAVGNLAFLFNCTPMGLTSDSMTVPT